MACVSNKYRTLQLESGSTTCWRRTPVQRLGLRMLKTLPQLLLLHEMAISLPLLRLAESQPFRKVASQVDKRSGIS